MAEHRDLETGQPARGWFRIDPLYVWSAAVGLVVAAVMIGVAALMR
ncbi:MAG TPA: hypothetical protein VMH81_22890 [Bryobacteraceae bacterium]|nr:hypothetical protein [Bryobacteraceae bacterium]